MISPPFQMLCNHDLIELPPPQKPLVIIGTNSNVLRLKLGYYTLHELPEIEYKFCNVTGVHLYITLSWIKLQYYSSKPGENQNNILVIQTILQYYPRNTYIISSFSLVCDRQSKSAYSFIFLC